MISLGVILLLGILLSGCTAKIAETYKSGLPAHLTVDLHLPKQLDLNRRLSDSVQGHWVCID